MQTVEADIQIHRPIVWPGASVRCQRPLHTPAHDDEWAICATALTRDLLDTRRAYAGMLFDAATRDAGAYLDACELDARAFAMALRRLASLHGSIAAKLVCAPV